MNRYLFLLRHAEAEREDVDGDLNRHLAPRGTESIDLLGENLRSRGERVQKIYSSTAVRAMQTARGVCSYLGYAEQDIIWQPQLYLASPGDLWAFLAACPSDCKSLMLVGHNPGLQNLMIYLAAAGTLPPDKSLTTAAIAKLEVPMDWESLQPQCARLVYLIRPEKQSSR